MECGGVNCRSTCAWEVAQLLTAGTCMTAHGVVFLNMLADLPISLQNNSTAPHFLCIACCLALQVQGCSLICFCAGGLSALQFPEQSPVCMLRTAFAPCEGQGTRSRAPASGQAACACSLACDSVAACLNFQACRSCCACFSELSELKAGLDVQTCIAGVSQAASTHKARLCCCSRTPPLLIPVLPMLTGLLLMMFSDRPAVNNVFREACCHLLQLMLVSQQH